MHAIGDGEYWRLMSSSLNHVNWTHFLLNLATLLILVVLYPHEFIGLRWLALLLMIILMSNIIIMAIYTDTVVYSGLSGALHGLVYIFALRNIATIIARLLLLLLFIKLLLEQIFPELLISGDLIHKAVFYDSHYIGVIAAVWVQILVRMAHNRGKSRQQS